VDLLILGASVRAAAFSALRAGRRPWCVDLFADADLRRHCPARRLAGRYPGGFAAVLETAPQAPWMYTGGLENYPSLVQRLAELRPLWGNNGPVLRWVRDPFFLAEVLRAEGLACPAVRTKGAPVAGRWLSKPLRGAGGAGVCFADRTPAAKIDTQARSASDGMPSPEVIPSLALRACVPLSDRAQAATFLQEYIEGESWGAIYAANGPEVRLLGATLQLVGEPWTHAAPFHYCGSIGPLQPAAELRAQMERLGQALVSRCGLRGLFGIDGIVRDGVFWPVEVNPRYSASVEVLEYATGMKALASAPTEGESGGIVGKAILFARHNGWFPERGPWLAALEQTDPIGCLPRFADIPDPGQTLVQGRPVLTFFARADSPGDCRSELQRLGTALDREVFGV